MKVTIHYLEKLIREWQRAYETANGKQAPVVIWENGWFRILGSGRVRRAKLETMRDELSKRPAFTPADGGKP